MMERWFVFGLLFQIESECSWVGSSINVFNQTEYAKLIQLICYCCSTDWFFRSLCLNLLCVFRPIRYEFHYQNVRIVQIFLYVFINFILRKSITVNVTAHDSPFLFGVCVFLYLLPHLNSFFSLASGVFFFRWLTLSYGYKHVYVNRNSNDSQHIVEYLDIPMKWSEKRSKWPKQVFLTGLAIKISMVRKSKLDWNCAFVCVHIFFIRKLCIETILVNP